MLCALCALWLTATLMSHALGRPLQLACLIVHLAGHGLRVLRQADAGLRHHGRGAADV
jgi:hypothetical protein